MLAAVEAALPAEIFVAAAAVADWRAEPAVDKIARGALSLSPSNPDILRAPTRTEPPAWSQSAAETRDLIRNARKA
jgi:phosphopantothenoylcysteine decarboxylase/phosphopantothenate--cysteine ligase